MMFTKTVQTLPAPLNHTNGNGKTPLIRVRNLVKTFKTAAGEVTVLKGINADFYGGEFVGVIGKSGSGKSTLINMITGIDRPTSGEIFVGDTAVHTLSENQLAIWRGQNLGIVFQFFQLLPMLTLAENIMLPMDFCNLYTPRERRERALHLLSLVEMEDHANKLPSAISGGQQQRVAITRALANDPPLVIADEPTGNLDSRTAETIFLMFENLVQQGKTIMMVTHDSSQAKRVSRTMLIADGEIVNSYVARDLPPLSPQQLLKASQHARAVTFQPGRTIIQQDTSGDTFYIITSGYAEVALARAGGNDIIVKRLEAGQYFGEMSLYLGMHTSASIHAAGELPLETLAIDRAAFLALLAESDETRPVIDRMEQARQPENQNHSSAH
jgi:ABC-type lipoprotein export system ATPase subunit